MRALPLPYRQALVLRYHEGLSVDDVARILEVPAGTVMSHLYRARLVLKRHLTRNDPIPLRSRSKR